MFRPVRWPQLPSFTKPEVTSWRLTEISWEEKVRVCDPHEKLAGSVSRNCGHLARLREDGHPSVHP